MTTHVRERGYIAFAGPGGCCSWCDRDATHRVSYALYAVGDLVCERHGSWLSQVLGRRVAAVTPRGPK